MSDDKNYVSDGAETWLDLLKNTALYDKQSGQLLISQRDRNFREDPTNTRQGDFFRTAMVDIPHKDDYSLMDINPFGLGKKPRSNPIVYEKRDAKITVTGSAEYGMATIYDYDIVIYMISHLTRQMNDLKYQVEQGEQNPQLPARRMKVSVADMFTQLKIKQGGKQIDLLKAKLRRLKGTVIEIEKKLDKGFRRDGSLSLIGDYSIDTETKSGNISEFYIDIPRWIYDGVVRTADPTVLTLCDGYMLLKSGYHKFLARIARKSAGNQSWEWSEMHLYEASGTEQPMKQFKRDLIEALKKLKKDPIPEYDFKWWEVQRGKRTKELFLRITPTGKALEDD